MGDLHAVSRDADGVQQREGIDRSQADARLASGCTLCGDVSGDPRVRRVLTELAASAAASRDRPFAKLYVSPPGRGYTLHADRYHVLVVQLLGRKRWWFGDRPAVPHALTGAEVDREGRAVSTHPRSGRPLLDDDGRTVVPPTDDALEQAVLSPGDCLYLPPGTWHRTEARSTSVALSLSPPRAPLVELLTSMVADALSDDPRWRADLGATAEGDVAAELAARLRELRAWLERLDPRALHRAWAMDHERRLAAVAGPAIAAERPIAVELDDWLERDCARPLRWLTAPGADGAEQVVFYGGGEEWSLPGPARAWVEALARASEFTPRQTLAWSSALEPADVREILTQLLHAGMVRRADHEPSG